MHELLLYGQVPLASHEQVLKIIAGVAAMQPQRIYERQLIYRPLRPSEEVKSNKKYPNKPIKPQSLTYHQLTKELCEADFGHEAPRLAVTPSGEDTAAPWVVKVQEIPEPETKAFIMRQSSENELTEKTLERILDPTNFTFVTELVSEGHRLIHKNVILTLFRLVRVSDEAVTAPAEKLPLVESLKPLDPSGAFVLEARIRIDDRTKPTLVSQATDDLNKFKNLMRGSVDMRAPDRLALDTRVR